MYKLPCFKIESDSYLILNEFNLINNAGLISSRMTKNQTTNQPKLVDLVCNLKKEETRLPIGILVNYSFGFLVTLDEMKRAIVKF